MTAPTTAPLPPGPDGRTDERPRAIVTDDRPPDSRPSVDTDALGALAEAALGALGVTGRAELSVTLVDEDTITELNREHLGGTGPTDVLSFPLEEPDADDPVVPGAPRLLGDLVICPTVAAANAPIMPVASPTNWPCCACTESSTSWVGITQCATRHARCGPKRPGCSPSCTDPWQPERRSPHDLREDLRK